MATIITRCNCETCDGYTPTPPGKFGGSSCNCICHRLRGETRQAWIKETDWLDKLWIEQNAINSHRIKRKLKYKRR